MTRIRVLLLILVALSGVLCDPGKNKEKETKRTVKPVEYKKVEKKSPNEKRESAELAEYYNNGQGEEPFRPIYQFHYPGAPLKSTETNYVTAATTQQLSYNKPDGLGAGPLHGTTGSGGDSSGSSESVQYAAASSYKPEGGIQYAPSSYKPSSGGGLQYASSAYRGPFIAASHQAPVVQGRTHPGPFYAAPPAHQPTASLALPLHYGRIEQPLPPQHHQQNQYAIAFPPEYMRHYQQNLAAPFPLHGAQMVQLVYAHNPGPPQLPSSPTLKDQQYKDGAVQYISLAPHLAAPPVAHSPGAVAGHPTVITHIIPYYGAGGPLHQQVQQPSPAAFYYGAYHQQAPPTSFAYPATALPHQQQANQKQQIYGPIQIAAVGAATAASAQHQQQLHQQPLNQFYQHYHPGAASYTRYPQSLSGSSGSGGSSNPMQVPTYDVDSSSAPKQGPLHPSPSSTNSGNTYSGTTGGGGGKMSYTYGSDTNYGPIYAHPGAIHYGTHLYQPPTKFVQIGSNRVTAGSAAIAGVAPQSYHPQQQSAANNSHGGRSSSNSVVKFA